MKSEKSLGNKNVKYLYRVSNGKLVGGESKHGPLYIRAGGILDQAVPTSLNELYDLGKATLKVAALAALLFGAGVVGYHFGKFQEKVNILKQRKRTPKIVEIINEEQKVKVYINGRYQSQLQYNPIFSEDPNTTVFTNEDYSR